MRGTSIIIGLKRDEIVQVGWFTGGENFVSKGDQFRDSRTGVMCECLDVLATVRAREF